MASGSIVPNEPGSSVDRGKEFERKIAHGYKRLGFRVAHDVHLSSSQTDLLCSKSVPGAPEVAVYVECKYRTDSLVTKQEAALFIATYQSLKQHHSLTAAALVTNLGFTAEAKAIAAIHADIRLITEAELGDELLNVHSSAHRFVQDYEKQEIFSCYIPLHLRTAQSAREEAMTWFPGWLTSKDRVAVLLGDFGAGKTTFLRHLCYLLYRQYLDSSTGTIPIYLQLREFARFPDLEAFAKTQLLRELGISDYQAFLEFLEAGRLLLLLDGFDEMGQQVDAAKRKTFFSALLPLFPSGSKAILTCRPSYFITDEEMTQVFSQLDRFTRTDISVLASPQSKTATARGRPFAEFQKAATEWLPDGAALPHFSSSDLAVQNLDLFSDSDIDLYLQMNAAKICEGSERNLLQLRERIRNTYDLEDLARRPILLNLIVSTLPRIEPGVEPSPAYIYSQYTAGWLNHDYSKGRVRWLIPKEAKLTFSARLAYQMYTSGELRIHYSALSSEVRQHFREVTCDADATYYETDVQTYGFLHRDSFGQFEFVHKSFVEFFTAVYIKEELKQRHADILGRRKFVSEVFFFLGDFVYLEPACKTVLRQALEELPFESSGALSDNLLGILGYARGKITNHKWLDVELDSVSCVGCTLTKVSVQTTKAHAIRIDRCTANGVNLAVAETVVTLDRTEASDLTIEVSGGTGQHAGHAAYPAGGITISASTLAGCSIRGQTSVVCARNSVLKRVVVSGSARTRTRAGISLGEVRFGRAQNEQLKLTVQDATFEDCVFRNCMIEGPIRAEQFKRCWFVGTCLPRGVAASLAVDGRDLVLTNASEIDALARSCEERLSLFARSVRTRLTEELRVLARGELESWSPRDKLAAVFLLDLNVHRAAQIDTTLEDWLVEFVPNASSVDTGGTGNTLGDAPSRPAAEAGLPELLDVARTGRSGAPLPKAGPTDSRDEHPTGPAQSDNGIAEAGVAISDSVQSKPSVILSECQLDAALVQNDSNVPSTELAEAQGGRLASSEGAGSERRPRRKKAKVQSSSQDFRSIMVSAIVEVVEEAERHHRRVSATELGAYLRRRFPHEKQKVHNRLGYSSFLELLTSIPEIECDGTPNAAFIRLRRP